MAKKLIKRLFPRMHEVRDHPQLKYINPILRKANLWHVNRNSVANAFAVGLFCAFVPIPFQMVLAALLAVLVGANVPISVLLVWISNPVTIPPIFYLCYKLGQLILQIPPAGDIDLINIDQLLQIEQIWQPFLLGCFIMSCTSAIVGYILVKILWRLHILSYLKQRRVRKINTPNIYKNK